MCTSNNAPKTQASLAKQALSTNNRQHENHHLFFFALAAGSLAAAVSLPLADPNDIVERKVATCRVKDPRAGSGDPWRTGACKSSKSACSSTGGEAYRYV